MDTRTSLLRALFETYPDYLSGSLMASRLSLSRVSIWNHIEQLNQEGFRIHAIRNRGYLLQAEPDVLHESALRAHLAMRGVAVPLHFMEITDSTNSDVDRLLNEEPELPFVVVAKTQQKGRGRRGNQWVSDSKGNLYLSFGFDPDLEISRMGHYTLWLGMCLCVHLKEQWGLDAKVKWPNDLFLNGRKLAGILTEAKIETDRIRRLIVGVGVNVNSEPTQFPEHLRARVSTVREALGQAVPVNDLGSALIQVVMEASERYFREDMRGELMERWADLDFLYGKRIFAVGSLDTVDGIASGIDASGHLRIRTHDERVHAVHSGEVTLAL